MSLKIRLDLKGLPESILKVDQNSEKNNFIKLKGDFGSQKTSQCSLKYEDIAEEY